MALFNQSSKAVSAAVFEIADSAGSSGDTEQTTRAWRSLRAGVQYLNAYANWDFAWVEATPVQVVPPASIAITASATNTSASIGSNHGVLVDDIFTNNFVQVGTRITATAANSIGFTQAILSSIGAGAVGFTATIVRDMYALPADWKKEYSLRLLVNQRVLNQVPRRSYDRSVIDEFVGAIPAGYDISTVGGKGKIRLLRPPNAGDILQMRYYRRMDVPSASASTASLDIPEDYESYLIAWSKWHYLTDRADGRQDQAGVWLGLFKEGIQVMVRDQTRKPDEDTMFVPGAANLSITSPNSTQGYAWDYGA